MANIEKHKIAILEDDPLLSQLYTAILSVHFDVFCYQNLEAFKKAITENTFSLFVLDLYLEQETYLFEIFDPSVLTAPFIVVSGHDTQNHIVDSFQKGATDFIAKPFSKSAFLCKVLHALNMLLVNQPIKLDLENGTCSYNKKTIKLTKKEYYVIKAVLKNFPKPIDRKSIIQLLSDNYGVTYKSSYTHFYNLKNKLAEIDLSFEYNNDFMQIVLNDETSQ